MMSISVPLQPQSPVRRDQIEQDLKDEFRDHRVRRIEADAELGKTPELAGEATLRALGAI
jgi:hypothetical protein